MTKYWALDYVDDSEFELIVDEVLYTTEEEAEQARREKPNPENYEVNWYGEPDLEEILGYIPI